MAYDNALVAGKLRRWEKYLNDYRLPAWNEIPDFGLYMEQVTVLLKQYLDYLPPELKEGSNESDGHGRGSAAPAPVRDGKREPR